MNGSSRSFQLTFNTCKWLGPGEYAANCGPDTMYQALVSSTKSGKTSDKANSNKGRCESRSSAIHRGLEAWSQPFREISEPIENFDNNSLNNRADESGVDSEACIFKTVVDIRQEALVMQVAIYSSSYCRFEYLLI